MAMHFEKDYRGKLSIWCDYELDEFLELHGDTDTSLCELFSRYAERIEGRAEREYLSRAERTQMTVESWLAWRERIGARPSGIYNEGEPCYFAANNEEHVLRDAPYGVYVTEQNCEYVIIMGIDYSAGTPYLVESNEMSELGLLSYNDASLWCPECEARACKAEGWRLDKGVMLEELEVIEVDGELPVGTIAPEGSIYVSDDDDTKCLCPVCGYAALEGGLV